jgi:chemotaxis signal transduction protein
MPHQNETTGPLRFIRFSIGNETFGLDTSWVRSIQRGDRLRHNPKHTGSKVGLLRAPMEAAGHEPVGWLPGNERDIPVFSLAHRLGYPPLPSLSTEEGQGISQRIVVLNPPQPDPQMGKGESMRPWGLLADRVSQVIQIQADRIVPLPPIPFSPCADYFESVIKLDEKLILLLSPERIHPEALPVGSVPVSEATSPSPSPDIGRSEPSAEEAHRAHGQIIIFKVTEPSPAQRAISFGLSISQVPEILEAPPVTPIPATPAFVLGLVNWRGLPVPVINLAGLLGLEQISADKRTRVIIARGTAASRKGAWVGIESRPAIRLLRLPIACHPSCRPLHMDPILTRGVFELENETLVIPSIQSILR